MGAVRRLAVVAAMIILPACGGGGEDKADEPDCPTAAGPQPTATTTVDPRCVERAIETNNTTTTTDSAAQTWKGVVGGSFQFPNCTPGTVSGDVTIDVGEDGTLSGRVDTIVSSTTCGGVQVGEQRVSVAVVGGSKSHQRFDIRFNDGSVAELAINGSQATGPLTQPGSNAEFVYLGNANGHTDITIEQSE